MADPGSSAPSLQRMVDDAAQAAERQSHAEAAPGSGSPHPTDTPGSNPGPSAAAKGASSPGPAGAPGGNPSPAGHPGAAAHASSGASEGKPEPKATQAASQSTNKAHIGPIPDGKGGFKPDPPGTLYIYTDGAGGEHLVDAWSDVPAAYRKKAKRWATADDSDAATSLQDDLSAVHDKVDATVNTAVRAVAGGPPVAGAPRDLHTQWMLIGVVVAALLIAASYLWRNRYGFWVRLAVVAAIVVLGGGAYLAWIRNQAGIDGPALERPETLIEHARRTAAAAERRDADEQHLLEQVDHDPPTRTKLP